MKRRRRTSTDETLLSSRRVWIIFCKRLTVPAAEKSTVNWWSVKSTRLSVSISFLRKVSTTMRKSRKLWPCRSSYSCSSRWLKLLLRYNTARRYWTWAPITTDNNRTTVPILAWLLTAGVHYRPWRWQLAKNEVRLIWKCWDSAFERYHSTSS